MITIDRRTMLKSAGAAALAELTSRNPLAQMLASPAPARPTGPRPPVARVEPVTETFFGNTVTDPYRWMENPKDKDWEPFMRGQADFARAHLDAIPGRDVIGRRVSELSGDLEVIGGIQVAGDLVFIEKRPEGANNYQLFVRDGFEGKDRLLIDPEARTRGDVHHAMNYWRASPDGKYTMYGMSPSGSENAVIEIMEVASGGILPERIDRAQYAWPQWLPDSSGFFFNRRAEGVKPGTTDYYKHSVCWIHKLNTDPATDIRVLARGQFPDVPVAEIDFPFAFTVTGSNYVIGALVAGVQNELTLYVNTLEAAARGQGGWKRICVPDDKVTDLAWRGDDIYLLTYKNAPRYRVLHVKATSPAVATAKEVVPQSDVVIKGLLAAKDAIYIRDLSDGIGTFRRMTDDGTIVPVALPYAGSIGNTFSDASQTGVSFGLQSWTRPNAIFRTDDTGKIMATTVAAKPTVDTSAFESVEVLATAKDGVTVPLSIVFKRGLTRDGSAPTLLEGYGAYGINSDPEFTPTMIAWLERGGVWATAHVRGGGERGREWHEGGRLLTKPNTWGDLIACAEHLIAERWTRAARLAINGRSAGGITVGRAMTDRPDLFAVVIANVGVHNTLRAEFSPNGPPNVPEFGSVTTREGFKGLYAMDSTVHVKTGVKYPATLLTTGMTDPRVEPWEVAKMAAHLQAATASGRPVLLRVEFQAGHGIGSTRAQRDAETADMFAFILEQTASRPSAR